MLVNRSIEVGIENWTEDKYNGGYRHPPPPKKKKEKKIDYDFFNSVWYQNASE